MQVSDLINCGVYVFTSDIFNAIEEVYSQIRDTCEYSLLASLRDLQYYQLETCFIIFMILLVFS